MEFEGIELLKKTNEKEKIKNQIETVELLKEIVLIVELLTTSREPYDDEVGLNPLGPTKQKLEQFLEITAYYKRSNYGLFKNDCNHNYIKMEKQIKYYKKKYEGSHYIKIYRY